jgi:very-short-patch-repair endonuclease
VRASRYDISRLLAEDGVVARRDHPRLVTALERLLRSGELAAVLPGVYASADAAGSLPTRIAAVAHWDPSAIITGAAAARLTFWPAARVVDVECAVTRTRSPQPGFRFIRRTIPSELVIERSGVRLTSATLTALDLAAVSGGDALDEALRARATTLDRLHQALDLTGARRGNRERRRLLLDSRDEPWSAAERLFHRLLRQAGITGWTANSAVTIDGTTYYLDVAFRRIRLAVEIDGRLHHSNGTAFETDRRRQNLLILDGWRVLRFTWAMLTDHPEDVIAAVRRALVG